METKEAENKIKAPDLVPQVRTTSVRRDFRSQKTTCRFCIHFKKFLNSRDKGHCDAKNCTVKETKRRLCSKGRLDEVAFKEAVILRQKCNEENPLIVWKQTEAFYERQYQKPEWWKGKR